MSRSDEILDLVGRFEAALNVHDLDTAMNLVSDDVVSSPLPQRPTEPDTKAVTHCGLCSAT